MQIHKKTHFYNFLKLIPDGKVITYGYLGKIFNIHPRVIGLFLKQNTNQDLIPCFKVVKSDLSIGGYNLGTDKKIQKLMDSGVKINNNRIDKKCIWDGKITNCFVAIPLGEESIIKHSKKINLFMKNYSTYNIRIQNPRSSHITILFYGNVSIQELHSQIKHIADNLPNMNNFVGMHYLDTLDNIDNRVYYLKSKDIEFETKIISLYNIVRFINQLKLQDREYVPHFTLFIKKNTFENVNTDLLVNYFRNYSLYLNIDRIRFYISYNGINQIPICDIIF